MIYFFSFLCYYVVDTRSVSDNTRSQVQRVWGDDGKKLLDVREINA